MGKLFTIFTGIIGVVVGGTMLGLLIGALFAWIMMLLWNSCLVGTIVGVSAIGFWKAWGLIVLSGFLFKGGIGSAITQFQASKRRVR